MLFNYIQLDDLITILNEQNESCIQNQTITAFGKKEKRKNQLTQLLRPGLAQIRGEEEEMEV